MSNRISSRARLNAVSYPPMWNSGNSTRALRVVVVASPSSSSSPELYALRERPEEVPTSIPVVSASPKGRPLRRVKRRVAESERKSRFNWSTQSCAALAGDKIVFGRRVVLVLRKVAPDMDDDVPGGDDEKGFRACRDEVDILIPRILAT